MHHLEKGFGGQGKLRQERGGGGPGLKHRPLELAAQKFRRGKKKEGLRKSDPHREKKG